MEKKYELTDESKELKNGSIVYRIKALRDFGDVKAGDLGGFIEKERNLSHEGNCWVYDDSHVCNNAEVLANAKIRGNSIVGHKARVVDDAIVENYSRVYDSAVVEDFSLINHGQVADYAVVSKNSEIRDCAIIGGNCEILGNQIMGNVLVVAPIPININIVKNEDSETILVTHVRKELAELNKHLKYELTDEIKTIYNGKTITLHRIKALRDFADVKKGDLGGWIEKEKNLSQEGNCWVYDEAIVMEHARVTDNAVVRHSAKVYDCAIILDAASILDDAEIFHRAHIKNKTVVSGDAQVYNDAWVRGASQIRENSRVYGNASVTNIIVDGNDMVRDNKICFKTLTRLNDIKTEEEN